MWITITMVSSVLLFLAVVVLFALTIKAQRETIKILKKADQIKDKNTKVLEEIIETQRSTINTLCSELGLDVKKLQ